MHAGLHVVAVHPPRLAAHKPKVAAPAAGARRGEAGRAQVRAGDEALVGLAAGSGPLAALSRERSWGSRTCTRRPQCSPRSAHRESKRPTLPPFPAPEAHRRHLALLSASQLLARREQHLQLQGREVAGGEAWVRQGHEREPRSGMGCAAAPLLPHQGYALRLPPHVWGKHAARQPGICTRLATNHPTRRQAMAEQSGTHPLSQRVLLEAPHVGPCVALVRCDHVRPVPLPHLSAKQGGRDGGGRGPWGGSSRPCVRQACRCQPQRPAPHACVRQRSSGRK